MWSRQKLLYFVLRIFVSSCLILSAVQSIEARPPEPSPAGGGYLQLDKEHDFVSTVKAWFPEELFEELTAEAWIYIERIPAPDTYWSVIGQEGRFNLVVHSFAGGTLGVVVRADGASCLGTSGGKPVPINEWVHVVALCNAGAGMGLNGVGGNNFAPGGRLRTSDEPLRVGGVIPKDFAGTHFIGENVKFRGYIDEVRISSALRYAGLNYNVPVGRFGVDKDTLCLWHFDEEPEAHGYEDVSGNGYHLWRSEKIKGGITHAVHAQDKLSNTWGKIKRLR